MKKFERLNKQNNEKEWYIGCQGTLVTIDQEPRINKISGKKYYRFTANLETGSGEVLVGGQLYERLIPLLGEKPNIGDSCSFNCKISDLREAQTNTRWGIGKLTERAIEKPEIKLDSYEKKQLDKLLELAMLKIVVNEGYPIKYRDVVFGNLQPHFIARFWQEIISLENKFKGITELHFFLKEPAEEFIKKYNTQEKISMYKEIKDLVNDEIQKNKKNSPNEYFTLTEEKSNKVENSFKNIYSISFFKMYKRVINSYVREFGEQKFEKIKKKIIYSKKVNSFINDSKIKKIPPYNESIINLLHQIPYFIFSRGQTVVLGGMLVLYIWNENVNMTENLLSEEELAQRARFLIEDSKSMFFSL